MMLDAKRTAMNRMVLDIGAHIQIQLRMMEIEQAYLRRDYTWQVTAMYDYFVACLLKSEVPPGWKHTWEPMTPEPRVPQTLPGEAPQDTGLSTHPAIRFGPQLPGGAKLSHSGLVRIGDERGGDLIGDRPILPVSLSCLSFLFSPHLSLLTIGGDGSPSGNG